MHHDSFRIGADDAPDLVADSHGHAPPALGPGAHSARGPNVGILMQPFVSGARHRAQTVRDQIDRSFQDWKLRTPFEKFVSQEVLRLIPTNLPQTNDAVLTSCIE